MVLMFLWDNVLVLQNGALKDNANLLKCLILKNIKLQQFIMEEIMKIIIIKQIYIIEWNLLQKYMYLIKIIFLVIYQNNKLKTVLFKVKKEHIVLETYNNYNIS